MTGLSAAQRRYRLPAWIDAVLIARPLRWLDRRWRPDRYWTREELDEAQVRAEKLADYLEWR